MSLQIGAKWAERWHWSRRDHSARAERAVRGRAPRVSLAPLCAALLLAARRVPPLFWCPAERRASRGRQGENRV